jgi:hypothetical protein
MNYDARRIAVLFEQARTVEEIEVRKRLLAEIYAELKSLRPHVGDEQMGSMILALLEENIKLRHAMEALLLRETD